ncbi:MAG: hypothetical protein Q8O12_00515 [Candidatus Omnitrophota bacterium]|nr:hypothetical protein [Candidatus Omnitrophota bacterium]
MKDSLKFTLVAVGICAVFFIMGREIIEARSKLRQAQDQAAQEKKEKAWIQEELKITRGELFRTGRDLRTARGKLAFVNTKIKAMKNNNSILMNARIGLERKIAILQQERKTMEAKLHSLSELKKAIRQVKLEIREDRIRQREESKRQQREIDKWETARGNRGFLTKDGEDYYRPKVNVEVRPASISLNKK